MKNLSNIKLPKIIKRIKDKFNQENFELYLVGGFVRDLLINIKTSDLDFTTDATPKQIISLFNADHKIKVIPTGIKHGTVTLVTNEENYEITTFRSDGKYLDYRHPESVIFSKNLSEDLKRRDFTINAITYNLNNKTIIDQHQGITDLKNKTIRCIGNPNKRFKEDALRMLRACRFSSQLGFDIEENTFQAIIKNKEIINKLSSERIRDELIKMVSSFKIKNNPAKGLKVLQSCGLLKIIIPEFERTLGVKQNNYHAFDVFEHSLLVVQNLKHFDHFYPYQLGLSALFHDIAKPLTKSINPKTGEPTFYNHEIIGVEITIKILTRLKFSQKDIKQICHLIRHHMFHYQPEWKDATIRKFIKKIGYENIDSLFTLVRSDRSGKKPNSLANSVQENIDIVEILERIKFIKNQDNCLSLKELKINGKDLIQNFRLTPGPILGIILNHLLEEVIENPKNNTKNNLFKLTRKYLGQQIN